MTPVRALPMLGLLAAAVVEPRGCSEQTTPSAIVQSQVGAVVQPAAEPGPAGAGCRVVPFQMDALFVAGVDDGLRIARVCCRGADGTRISIEASDPSLRLMVSEHGPLRRFMARWCLDPAHPQADHVITGPTGELCAGARCGRIEVR